MILPTRKQLEFQDWEFGIFLHFGIRTFYEGHRDWDGKPMSPQAFQPSQLDCDQWVRTAKEAGARYMVLTAKHHDGFANWPSKYTDFSVAASPWRGGKGDVVGDFTHACRRHGMKVGLYYSPADASKRTYTNPKAYDDYFIGQIGEILTGYGEIHILWFDGCGSEGHTYDWPRIIGEIRRMQPGVLIFNMGDPDFRWVGNEAGVAPLPIWNVVDSVPFSIQTEESERLGGARLKWLPAECDCRMRARNWFYSDQDEHTVKSLPELMGLYYYSVGRGCNLLLNIGPDRRGLLPDADARRLLEFGAEIRRRFSHPLATLGDFTREGDTWSARFPEGELVDHAVVQEELAQGERIRRFQIQAVPAAGGKPITLYEGYNVGHKAICRFPPLRVREVCVRVTEACAPPQLRSLSLHLVEGC
ncbi:MAG: alpha-L-fucosidase [Armatimonadota bacterium]|nr:alpha-L-fucosidase [Armatimonadota bacterium]